MGDEWERVELDKDCLPIFVCVQNRLKMTVFWRFCVFIVALIILVSFKFFQSLSTSVLYLFSLPCFSFLSCRPIPPPPFSLSQRRPPPHTLRPRASTRLVSPPHALYRHPAVDRVPPIGAAIRGGSPRVESVAIAQSVGGVEWVRILENGGIWISESTK